MTLFRCNYISPIDGCNFSSDKYRFELMGKKIRHEKLHKLMFNHTCEAVNGSGIPTANESIYKYNAPSY
jgi:hypothetical protein